jgi:hypothetical protein
VRPRSATGTIIAATLLLACDTADAQSRPEYDAEIADDRVFAFSGPGTNFYPTNILNRDDKVTVYGLPIGDYVQILPPPERSFSWIRGTDVEEKENGDCVVKIDGAGVYVGSEIHREARFVRQVRLPRGAKVRVLDKVMVQGVGPDVGRFDEWYKILPPEDEVRYVLTAKIRQPNQGVLVTQSPTDGKGGDSKTKGPPKGGFDVNGAPQPIVKRMFRPDEPIPPAVPVSGSKLLEAKATSSAADKPKARRPAGANAIEIERLRNDLERIQDKLPQEWNLETLEKRLRSLEASADGAEGGEVKELRTRMTQMRSVERRLKEIEDRGRQYKQTDQQLAAEIERLLGKGPRAAARFAAQGILESSKTLVDGKKAYQLVDAQKRPTHLLVPAPGINLDRHLRRRVGVIARVEPRTGVSLPVLRVTQASILEE